MADYPVTPHTPALSEQEIIRRQKLQSLIDAGFSLEAIVEPEPTDEMLDAVPEMKDELRRPMMLLVRAAKRA